MENTNNNINKAEETLSKELESMSNEGLRDFFKFFYKLNHQHYNMIAPERFEEFLESFEKNSFKINEDTIKLIQHIEFIHLFCYLTDEKINIVLCYVQAAVS